MTIISTRLHVSKQLYYYNNYLTYDELGNDVTMLHAL